MTNLLNETYESILKDILMLSQEQLHAYAINFLSTYYKEEEIFEHHGEGVYFAGDIPVLLVAHMDTVHLKQPTPDTLFYDREKEVMWSPNGIGADCRAGVFNVLATVSKGYRPHIMLTWEEERGGIGAGKLMDRWGYQNTDAEAVMVQEHMTKVNFAIQYDRHGFDEAVYYDLDSKEFEDYISSYGYQTKIGSYTDICEICPAFGFAGVNVAAGYIDEHTKTELLFVEEMLKTQKRVIQILEDQMTNPKFFPYVALPSYSTWGNKSYGSGSKSSSGYGWYDWDDYDDEFGYGSCSKGKSVKGTSADYEEANDLQFDETSGECYACGIDLVLDENWSSSAVEIQDALCYKCRVKYCESSADIPSGMEV